MANYSKGSLWRKWDLQVQPIQNRWLYDASKNKSELTEKIRQSCVEFIKEAERKELSVVGITDHNNGFAIDLCQSIETDLVILPGVEIDTNEGWHMLIFFSDDYKARTESETWGKTVETFLQNICDIEPPFYKPKDVSKKIGITTINLLKRIHQEKIGVAVFAHCCSKDGFFQCGDATIRRNIIKAHHNKEFDFLFEIKDNFTQLDLIKDKLTGWGFESEQIGVLSSSDAHSASNVGDCFSWIKADPTFEGLKQTLFEPKNRVRIQSEFPDNKRGYYVIDKVLVNYTDIFNKEIELHPELNCIIGGRSTGKSILLSAIAKRLKVDSEAKANKPKYNELIGNISSSMSIVWKDGIKDDEQREIEFFNQGYMNKYSTEREEFDKLIEDILKEKLDNNHFQQLEEFCTKNKVKIFDKLRNLFSTLNKIEAKSKDIEEIGDIKGIENEIEITKEKIRDAKLKISMSNEEYEQFEQLRKEIQEGIREVSLNKKDQRNLTLIKEENTIPSFSTSYELSNDVKLEIDKLHGDLVKEFMLKWRTGLSSIFEEIQKQTSFRELSIESTKSLEVYKKGEISLKESQFLRELSERLTEEENKKAKIALYQQEIKNFEDEATKIRAEILRHHNNYLEATKRIAAKLVIEFGPLKIKGSPKFLSKKYNRLLKDSINLQGTERKNLAHFDYEILKDLAYEKEVKEKFDLLLSKSITLKNRLTHREFIERLLPENFYRMSFEVSYENDLYDEMSEGKQAFVVLTLLLEYSDKKCPILIDQPEDDLDNRAIYVDLVTYLRNKKNDRQIIVVTHNPNIVVGTDSELVIVANQHGSKNANSSSVKFEYCGGSIENTYIDSKTEIILQKQGIREHICEVLEGGEKAFKQRERRYEIKK